MIGTSVIFDDKQKKKFLNIFFLQKQKTNAGDIDVNKT